MRAAARAYARLGAAALSLCGAGALPLLHQQQLPPPLPPLPREAAPAPPPPPPPPPALLRRLDSDAALAALLAEPRALVLVSRGFAPAAAAAALAALQGALAALGPAAPPAYVVDGDSAQVPALTFTETLGLANADPYVVVLEDFKRTRRKYLLQERGVPSASATAALCARVAAGAQRPALLGQPRPPRDASPTCPALVEVVSDSFEELVLAPRAPVLLLVHRRSCDACKAFAPRYRMLAQLAAQHLPALRVAALDAGDNDLDFDHVPESWTPVLRFFPALQQGAQGAAEGAARGAPPPPRKPSVLLDTRVDGLATKIHLPTLPQVLEFLAEHSGGALQLTPALRQAAGEMEEEAASLELAYDQVLQYVQLWKAHSEVVAAAAEGGSGSGSGGSAAGERASALLKERVLECYGYVVKSAAAGGAEGAWERLDGIAHLVDSSGIAAAVAAAAREMQGGADVAQGSGGGGGGAAA